MFIVVVVYLVIAVGTSLFAWRCCPRVNRRYGLASLRRFKGRFKNISEKFTIHTMFVSWRPPVTTPLLTQYSIALSILPL
jgi:hypothetical protein